MAFHVDNKSVQLSQFIVLLIFTPLSILVTLVRFFALRQSRRKLNFEDFFAILATIFAVLCNIGGLLAVRVLNGRSLKEEIMQSPRDFTVMRKIDLATLYMYFFNMLTVKFSVLALYRRIFGVRRSYLYTIYFLGALQFVFILSLSLLHGLQCRPLAKYWDLTVKGKCLPEIYTIAYGSVVDSVIDFAMVALAMVMIRDLQLAKSVKWKLRALFGVGLFVGIIGFIKLGIVYSTDSLYGFSMVSLWTGVQMFLALACASLPVYGPILPNAVSWNRLTSLFTRGSRSRSSGRTTGRAQATAKSGESAEDFDKDAGSSKGLSFVDTHGTDAHGNETVALANLRKGSSAESSLQGIKVTREVDILR